MKKIGGLVENQNLTLYQVSSVMDRPGVAGNILRYFAGHKINFEYITESSTSNGTAVIAVGIRSEKDQQFDAHLEKIQQPGEDLQIIKIQNVSVLGIYGPHFREKPALAAEFCTILGKAGINILGLSSSISSICGVIRSDEVEHAKSALLKHFELP